VVVKGPSPGKILPGEAAVGKNGFDPAFPGPIRNPPKPRRGPLARTVPCPPQKSCKSSGFRVSFPRDMRRLGLLTVVLLLQAAVCAPLRGAEISLDYIAKLAEDRARKPFRSPKVDLPDFLKQDQLDYDKYREIRFRRDNALWTADRLPFRVEFFHPGYLYQEPVQVNEFTLTHSQPIRFVPEFFDYGNTRLAKKIPPNTGYAGFRLLFELNKEDQMDELGAFLGGSYFRLLGKGQRYGQSARGLAIDSGESDRPEEFPIFTDWWLGKPHRDDDKLRMYAILDSVSCAGAFSFTIQPGETTIADVEAVLYLRADKDVQTASPQRKAIKTLGLAPLTSMFWFGENSERKFDDYRPEVHDSDGLLVRMDNGEVIWRPLNNASVMRHQTFSSKGVRGYGLLQRDRNFASYQDIFNLYHLVPSVWIEPRGNWGEGDIHLVELSTSYEGLDNIVAFWDPKEKPEPMKPLRFGYTMFWTREIDRRLSENIVTATRIGAESRNKSRREICIDFKGPKLDSFTEADPPQAVASCSTNGTIAETLLFRNAFEGTWRVILKLQPAPGNTDPIDLRCTLKKNNEVASETWTYLWSPP
jgi:glucans biosynthesis protein